MKNHPKATSLRWLKAHRLIWIFALFSTLGIAIPYIIAVSLNHVTPFLPYVSDAGTEAPESCIFSLLLNCSVVALVCILYIRQQQVADVSSTRRFAFANDLSLLLGLAGAFGMMVVANFQLTSVLSVHLLGALISFINWTAYYWLQAYITLKMSKRDTSLGRCYKFRFFLAFQATFFSAVAVVGVSVASFKSGSIRAVFANNDWDASDPGYGWFLLSTICEWILMSIGLLYVMSFYKEFKQFNVSIITQQTQGKEKHEATVLV